MSFGRRGGVPWSRLKAAPVDALESMGLVSKGDERLLDLKTQETFFSTIVTRYMQFCADTGRSKDDLDSAFRALSLNRASTNEMTQSQEGPPDSSSTSTPSHSTSMPTSTTIPSPAPSAHDTSTELGTIVMAMRKLREGLVGSGRADGFAMRALMFIVRATILTASWEAYAPSLHRLLHFIHPRHALGASDVREFAGYLVLDLACRQGALGEALLARRRWKLRDERTDAALRALMRDDYGAFWRVHARVDGYQRRLLSFAEDGVRRHALKCLGRSYLSADKAFVERAAHRPWHELKQKDKVGWELEGDRVIIRKITRK